MCEWSDKFGSLSDIATAISTLITLIFAFYIGKKTNKIAKYQSRQNDRKRIEDILILQEESSEEFIRDWMKFNLGLISKIAQAKYKSNLYNLVSIEEHINKINNDMKEAYGLKETIFDRAGMPSNQYTQKKLDRLHELMEGINKNLSNTNVYKEYLGIKN